MPDFNPIFTNDDDSFKHLFQSLANFIQSDSFPGYITVSNVTAFFAKQSDTRLPCNSNDWLDVNAVFRACYKTDIQDGNTTLKYFCQSLETRLHQLNGDTARTNMRRYANLARMSSCKEELINRIVEGNKKPDEVLTNQEILARQKKAAAHLSKFIYSKDLGCLLGSNSEPDGIPELPRLLYREYWEFVNSHEQNSFKSWVKQQQLEMLSIYETKLRKGAILPPYLHGQQPAVKGWIYASPVRGFEKHYQFGTIEGNRTLEELISRSDPLSSAQNDWLLLNCSDVVKAEEALKQAFSNLRADFAPLASPSMQGKCVAKLKKSIPIYVVWEEFKSLLADIEGHS
ncbi:hypothetical protein [Vibrio campbellii]|uniref:hypothetical protein n=1 Tax=Vibrio campbellii TaxID=680 RepID=UPI0038CD4FF7